MADRPVGRFRDDSGWMDTLSSPRFPTIGIPVSRCISCPAMTRETATDSRQDILHTAARLFQQRGYDATSMNDIAATPKLSKGGLNQHLQSKVEILINLLAHSMS